MINRCLNYCNNPSLGILFIRLALALVFITHGFVKLQDMGSTVGFFASLGLPAFLAWLVALLEFVGGIMILIGLGTGVVGILLSLVMVGAIYLVKFQAGFLAGYAFDLVLLLSLLSLVFTGSGDYSVRKFFK